MANGFFLEGSALALPKISSTSGDVPSSFVNLWRVGLLPDRLRVFGVEKPCPTICRRINSALRKKFRHQPLAEASGMGSFRTHSLKVEKVVSGVA